MKRLYVFLITAVVILAGAVVFSQYDADIVTVTENAKAAYGSCQEHTYDGDYKTITVATCKTKGTKYRTCTVCGYKDIVETAKDSDNHTELDTDEWIYFPEATCVESGVRYHVCYACNAHVDVEVVPENENSHKGSGQYVIVTESTCSTKGVQAEICELCQELCNHTDIAFNPSKHTVSETSKSAITVVPSCALEGEAVTYCDNCNNVAVKTPIPPTGNHVPNKELIIDVAPNCTYEGSCSYHCSICDTPMYVQSLAVEPDAHEYADYTVDTPATCVSTGEKSKYCIHCNNRTDVAEIPVDINAHSYGEEWVITKEATCAEMGLKHKVCTLCSCNSVSVLIEKTDHSYGEDCEILQISADELSAQVKYTCTVCDNEYITIIPYNSGSDNSDYTSAGYYKLKTVNDSDFKVDYDSLIVSNVKTSVIFKNFSLNFKNLDAFSVYGANGKSVGDYDIIVTGTRINHRAENGKVTNYYVSVKGDIDGDGEISAADARKVLRASASIDTLSGAYEVAANVNGDDRVSAADARMILRVSAGLDNFKYD